MITSTRYSFTVRDYARMRSAGILAEDDRVELLDGDVRQMSPIGPFHAALVNRLTAILMRLLGDTAIVSIQNPIQLNDYSEPQPDVVIMHPRDDYYAHAHPRPDDILVVIEIADSSIDYERDEKMPRYAEAGISGAWLIDVTHQQIEHYTQPRNGVYRQKVLLTTEDQIQSVQYPQITFAIGTLFPEAR